MKIYTRAWRVLFLPIGALATLAGLIVAPFATLVASVLLAAVLGAVASLPDRPSRQRPLHPVKRAATWGILTGTGAGAMVAITALIGALILPCLLITGATSPPLINWLVRRARGPSALSDQGLCCAWSTTTMALRVLRSPAEQLALATRRQDYLDELERRNPHGFQAWLATGDCADHTLENFILGEKRSTN